MPKYKARMLLHPVSNEELLSVLKIICAFQNAHCGSSVRNDFEEEETEVSSLWGKGQRMKRAMECESCHRYFPQERSTGSVLHPLQQPVKGQVINICPGSLQSGLFKGCKSCHHAPGSHQHANILWYLISKNIFHALVYFPMFLFCFLNWRFSPGGLLMAASYCSWTKPRVRLLIHMAQ